MVRKVLFPFLVATLLVTSAAPAAWAHRPAGNAETSTRAPQTILTVDTAVDESDGSCVDGDCSLRDAIAVASPGDTVDFAGDYTIYLTSTLAITRQLTVDGSGRAITVSGDTGSDGSPNVRVFEIGAGAAVTLSHVSIVSGTADYGGGIYNEGTLVVTQSTLSGNSAAQRGGGVHNSGTLTVDHSTLSTNSAPYGGGVYNYVGGTLAVTDSTFSSNSAGYGAGIYKYAGTATVANSTLSGNSAATFGGGVLNLVGALTLTHCTLSGNSSGSGGGIYNNTSGTLNFANTLVANSSSGGDCVNEGLIGTNSHNLVEDGTCSAAFSGDPQLSPLSDNGGDTLTHALLYGSPAIDAVPPASCTLPTDQRGVARPYPAGGSCDIGAVELDCSYVVTVQNADDSGAGSLRQAILEVCSGGRIDFAGDYTIYLTSTLAITRQLTVDGSGRAVTVSGDTGNDGTPNVGVFEIGAGAVVTMSHLGIISGTAAYGGGVSNEGALTVISSTLSGNSAVNFGGGIVNGGALTVTHSTLSGNSAGIGGGILNGGVLTVDDSTFSGNSVSGETFVYGGGIANAGVLTVTHSTLSDNSGSYGGGICNGLFLPEVDPIPGTLTVSGSTLFGNSADMGGGILNLTGTLTVDASALSGNSADIGGGINNLGVLMVSHTALSGNLADQFGGGIFNMGALTVTHSTLSDNSALGGGGGIHNVGVLTVTHSTLSGNSADTSGGGGIANGVPAGVIGTDPITGTLTVTNSTFSGNSTAGLGGGIHNWLGTLTLIHSTLSDNSAGASGGGGIYNDAGGTLHYAGTIVANSSSGGDCVITGTLGTNSDNLVEDGSCSAALSGDPLLGPLAGNGGDTLTHALLPGSLAIDAVPVLSCTLETDQRGVARPWGTGCDIGAFELRGWTLTPGGGSGQSAYRNTAFARPLTLTVSSAYGEPVDGGQVQFAGPAGGAGISPITYTATISGGVAAVVVTANNTLGSYHVVASAPGAAPPVTYTLANTNAAPDAVDDAFTVDEDSTGNALDVLTNDTYLPDPPETLTVSAVGPPDQGGTVVFSSVVVTYTPAADFFGMETFTYTITDGNGGYATALVTVTVSGINDAPVAVDDAYTTTVNTMLVVAAPGVLHNDSDVEGDPLSAILVAPPLTGTVELQPDGSFVYTPTVDFHGVVTFTYRASDDVDDSNVATVTIAVRQCNVYLPLVLGGYAPAVQATEARLPVVAGNHINTEGSGLWLTD